MSCGFFVSAAPRMSIRCFLHGATIYGSKEAPTILAIPRARTAAVTAASVGIWLSNPGFSSTRHQSSPRYSSSIYAIIEMFTFIPLLT
ncbi:MAG: hypothetical protein LUH52_07025 [Bacteroides uniformis]|nr:hypothetical protein [Bacteroides uniformis]